MALSLAGWLNGVSASGVVIFGCVFGLFLIYKSRKTNAKLLFYWALASICIGLCWLGDLVNFLTILFTGKNMDNSYGWTILTFIWLPPSMLFAMYVGAELLMPEKKWYIVGIIVVLGIFFELFIFIDPIGSFTVVYPDKPGEDLINSSLAFGSPAFIFGTIFMLFGLIFFGFGFLYKSIKSKGVIRKKFLLLSIGEFLFSIFAGIDGFTISGIALFLIRCGVLSSFWLIYLGLREEPEKKEELKPKKEIKVVGDLFRIAKYKKEDITEEEVSISKEKKICLVCKGRVRRCFVYICECDTFYCEKCARALENLENECWVCGIKFDESKPVKPFKKDEEEIELEVSDKTKKKLKTNKSNIINRTK